MKATITQKLIANGINPVGMNEYLVNLIYNAVKDVRAFGMDYWLERTTAGIKVKNIVAELV